MTSKFTCYEEKDSKALQYLSLQSIEWSDDEDWETVIKVRKREASTFQVTPIKKEKGNKLEDSFSLHATLEQEKWNSLPDEIFLEIFQFLSLGELYKVSLVCSKWKRVAYYPILYKNLNLSGTTLNQNHLTSILSRCPRVLNFKGNRLLIDPEDSFSKPPKVTLVELKLREAKLCDLGLKILSSCTSNLKILDLSWSTSLTDLAISTFLKSCPLLECLDLTSSQAGDLTMASLENCPKLIHLNISWCPEITSQGFLKIVKIASNLITLTINGCHLLNEKDVVKVLNKASNMKNFFANDCNFARSDFCDAVSLCQKLENLQLNRCARISYQDVYHILNSLPRLRYFQCIGVLTLSETVLFSEFPNLVVVTTKTPFSRLYPTQV